ncbi:hypothetical protein J7E83_17115 [Arthrobacter sp. ISL-48]|uniref:HAD domain-containing protein n=1 Tax=Arthrobacter sp. ISL-48 TaxID=2819110 RepID=UPI001BE5B44B|nr:HAD domain-containing protein [Arthrobacter sp. ISL-48]MBT2533814.1 hypothetical protein [Arthrobacter sp. ISL-48]
MTRASLYLDVDGVVCPFGPVGESEWGSEWRFANAGLLSVAFAQELVDGLNSLASRAGLRCVWLTSWEDLAPEYLCPAIDLHAGHWPYLTADGETTGEGWWKLRAIQEDVAASGPDALVWIDDQLRFEQEAQAWARFLGRRILLVSPDPRRGISPRELSSVRSFLEQPVF